MNFTPLYAGASEAPQKVNIHAAAAVPLIVAPNSPPASSRMFRVGSGSSINNTPSAGRPSARAPPSALFFPGDIAAASTHSNYLMGNEHHVHQQQDNAQNSNALQFLESSSNTASVAVAAAAVAATVGPKVQFLDDQAGRDATQQNRQWKGTRSADSSDNDSSNSTSKKKAAARKVERREQYLSSNNSERLTQGQEVPLIKPRYGPHRRNKESIRVSTNLTLGQQHDTPSQLLRSGASGGTKPETMTVSAGNGRARQHYTDELHFDSPYAMFQTRSGQIITHSVGWSKRGDFVVERSDLVLTSDCYCSDSDGGRRKRLAELLVAANGGGKAAAAAQTENSIKKEQTEEEEKNKKRNNDDDDDDDNDKTTINKKRTQSGSSAAVPARSGSTKRLHVASTRFEPPVCLDPAAPKPREVVSDGELRTASKGLWHRKYPGVKCPKNRRVRNRLMNDYFVNEHTRPIQLEQAAQQRKKGCDGAKAASSNSNNSVDHDDDDSKLHDQHDEYGQLSFKVGALPKEFVDFAGMSEKQQQQLMQMQMQQQQHQQPQAKVVDPNTAEGRWARMSQKHRQELAHAIKNTNFMPIFIRDVESQVRAFLQQWHEYLHDEAAVKKKASSNKKSEQQEHLSQQRQQPDLSFDVLCTDGYGRLITHCVAQFYQLSSQSHDRCVADADVADAAEAARTSPTAAAAAASSGEKKTSPTTTETAPLSKFKRMQQQQQRGQSAAEQQPQQQQQPLDQHFQRITRIALTSAARAPPIPTSTMLSLFPQQNVSAASSPNLQASAASVANKTVNSNSNNNNGTEINTSFSALPPSQQSEPQQKQQQQQSKSQPGKRQQSSPPSLPAGKHRPSPRNSPPIAPAPAPPSTSIGSNRFAALSLPRSSRRNNDDTSSVSSSSSLSDAGNRVSRPKRFRKRLCVVRIVLQDDRRAILPLLNENMK